MINDLRLVLCRVRDQFHEMSIDTRCQRTHFGRPKITTITRIEMHLLTRDLTDVRIQLHLVHITWTDVQRRHQSISRLDYGTVLHPFPKVKMCNWPNDILVYILDTAATIREHPKVFAWTLRRLDRAARFTTIQGRQGHLIRAAMNRGDVRACLSIAPIIGPGNPRSGNPQFERVTI